MQNFIAQSMRRFGLAPKNTVTPTSPNGGNASSITNDPLSHMNIEGKYAYSTLSYPLDLQSRSDLGHYMMFYVNVANQTAHNKKSDDLRRELGARKEAAGKGGTKLTSKQGAQLAILIMKEVFLQVLVRLEIMMQKEINGKQEKQIKYYIENKRQVLFQK